MPNFFYSILLILMVSTPVNAGLADLLEFVPHMDKIKSVLNIGEKTGLISSMDAMDVKRKLYQSKRFYNQTIFENAYDFVPLQQRRDYNDLKYISRELDTIIGVDFVKDSVGWAQSGISDLYNEIIVIPELSSDTKKEIKGYEAIQNSLSDDLASSQVESTVAEYENLKHQSLHSDFLSKIAGGVKTIHDNIFLENATREKRQELERQATQSLNDGFANQNKVNKEKAQDMIASLDIDTNGQTIIDQYKGNYSMLSQEMKAILLVLCFLISIVWAYLEVVASADDKSFPIVALCMKLALVVVLLAVSTTLFSFIVQISDSISDKITELSQVEETFLQDRRLSTDSSGDTNTGWGSFIGDSFLGALKTSIFWIVNGLLTLSYIVVVVLRDYILLILYYAFPLVTCLSLIPLFSIKLLFKYIILFIQVASWSIFQSLFFMVFKLIEATTNTDLIGGSDTFQAVFYAILAVVMTMFIPKIASAVIGGGDFSIITAASSVAAGGTWAISKMGAKTGVFGANAGSTLLNNSAGKKIGKSILNSVSKSNPQAFINAMAGK